MDYPRPKRYLNARWTELIPVLRKFSTSAQYVAKSLWSNRAEKDLENFPSIGYTLTRSRFGGVGSRDGLGLGRIGTPGYRAHRSVAMAPMFKGIRFGRHHFCSEV